MRMWPKPIKKGPFNDERGMCKISFCQELNLSLQLPVRCLNLSSCWELNKLKLSCFHLQRVLKLRKRVTLMAVTVSVIFAVCWLTESISYVLSIYTSAHTFSDITYVATSIMIMFNSSVNPIVYALVNTRFREKIKRMMCCNNRLETDVHPLTGEPRGSTWPHRTIHPTLETREVPYNTRATYIWQEPRLNKIRLKWF